jgi:hypothetical protein
MLPLLTLVLGARLSPLTVCAVPGMQHTGAGNRCWLADPGTVN